MKIAIYGRSYSEEVNSSIEVLFTQLIEEEVEVLIYQPFYSFLKERIKSLPEHITLYNYHSDLDSSVDAMISIGGDGTILDAVTLIRDSEIPILGVNTGRLGFLASISKDEIKDSIIKLLQKRYQIDERALIKLDAKNDLFGDFNYALNEFSVHKKESSSMITIQVFVNGEYLNTYWADGLIVATTTGSTAYSLSCGGPIMIPGSQNVIITPIAPHTLTVRPVVLSSSEEISIKVEGRGKNFLAALDSRTEVIDSSYELKLSKSDFRVKIIQLEGTSYLTTLRNKLNWGIDRRN